MKRMHIQVSLDNTKYSKHRLGYTNWISEDSRINLATSAHDTKVYMDHFDD